MSNLARLRHHKDFPGEDVALFIVSYPKAGRTWVRYILSRLAEHELADPQLALSLIDDDKIVAANVKLQFTHAFSQRDEFHLNDLHEAAQHLSRRPFIFLHRDPRDVVVSHYHERTKRSLKTSYFTPSDINEFAMQHTIGLPRVIAFYNIWAKHFDRNTCRLVCSYEELHEHAAKVAKSIFNNVFGFSPSDSSLTSALQESDFGTMQQLERASFDHPRTRLRRLRPYDVNDPDSYKVRKGLIGGYRDELDSSTQEFAASLIRTTLDPLYKYC